MIAAILTYLSNFSVDGFLSGSLDPNMTHILLLGGSILAEFAVAAGIVTESHWPKTIRQWLGVILVIGGVVIGAIFTVSLFLFDEGVSQSQQATIGNLGVRAAQLSNDAEMAKKQTAELERSNLELKDRMAAAQTEAAAALLRAANIERKYAWRTLQPEEKAKFLDALKGEKFRVILEYSTSDPEAFEYANQFFGLLKLSSLEVSPHDTVPLPRPRGICLNGTPDEGREKLANALTAAGLSFGLVDEPLIGTEEHGVLRLSIGGRFAPQ